MQALDSCIKVAQESIKLVNQQLYTPSEHAIKIAAIQNMLTQEQAECQQQKIALEQNQRLQQSNIEMLNKRHQHLTERQDTLEQQIREREQTIIKNARIK